MSTKTSTTVTVAPTKTKLSRSKIVDLMRDSGGKFMTILWKKTNGETRLMNCKVKKGTSLTKLGYLPVTETATKITKSVDPRTIISLKVNKVEYTATK